MQFALGVSNGLLARGYNNERIHALVTDLGKESLERGINAFVTALAESFVPTFDLATGTFQWEVNYDESLVTKAIVRVTKSATDEKFPDDRTGKRIVVGSIKHFACQMGQEAVEGWAKENNKILAKSKDLIDFSKAFPRPALDNDLPLVAAGHFWQGAGGRRHYLYLFRLVADHVLHDVWIDPNVQWHSDKRFLVLDK